MKGLGTPPPVNMMRSSSVQRCLSGAAGEDKDSGKHGVNVKVIVRCRPPSDLERKDPSQFQVVSTKIEAKEVFVSQTIPGRKVESYSKTFTFDGVCNQFTTQQELFLTYIVPIVDEVLQGFNCTIFAYGQTGTGKTFTMEGDIYAKSQRALLPDPPLARLSSCTSTSVATLNCNSLTEQAGVIPRSVQYIFERLEAHETEYSVRVSYLEIYNEELNDLLNDGDKQNLRIFEDSNGKKGLSVDRLEEIPVNNPQDIFNILSIAVKKRRTAETLLNRQSSRSHCIFSVMIHMKETNIDGEDVIKIGKLNLVDLAGSENIQRSGANTMKDRAKEAGMINQSLLTLGRVINALVEHSSYVPYRDSKLTRLLQESLGGRTKTCIVATISPSSLCLEETLSTLDYAFRAKNIRNRPEVNQKMTKRVMIRELNQEIEKLKIELQMNREKNGVYMTQDRHTEMLARLASQSVELTDAISEISKMKADLALGISEVGRLKGELAAEVSAHNVSRHMLEETTDELNATKGTLQTTMVKLNDEVLFSSHLRKAEEALNDRCVQLMSHISSLSEQLSVLQEKLTCCRLSGKNQASGLENLCGQKADLRVAMEKELGDWKDQWKEYLLEIRQKVISINGVIASEQNIGEVIGALQDATRQDLESLNEKMDRFESMLQKFDMRVHSCIELHFKSVDQSAEELIKSAGSGVEVVQQRLQDLSNLIQSFSNDCCSLSVSNRKSVDEFMLGLRGKLSSLGSSIDGGLSCESSSMMSLMRRLSEFKERHSQSLVESMNTIRHQLASHFDEVINSQRLTLSSEVCQLISTCQLSKEAIESLKVDSSKDINEHIPSTLIQFEAQLIPQLNTYDAFSVDLAKKHSLSTGEVMNVVRQDREVLANWNESQHKKNGEFMKSKLPVVLSERSEQASTLKSDLEDLHQEIDRRVQNETATISEKIASVLTGISDQTNLLEAQLSQTDDLSQSHISQLYGSLVGLETTTNLTRAITEELLNEMRVEGDTPRCCALDPDLQTLPPLVAPRDILIAGLETTSTTLEEVQPSDDVPADIQMLTTTTTTSDPIHEISSQSDVPIVQRPVLLPPSSRSVSRATSSRTGSTRRSASLNKRRRDDGTRPVSAEISLSRRASAGSQISPSFGTAIEMSHSSTSAVSTSNPCADVSTSSVPTADKLSSAGPSGGGSLIESTRSSDRSDKENQPGARNSGRISKSPRVEDEDIMADDASQRFTQPTSRVYQSRKKTKQN